MNTSKDFEFHFLACLYIRLLLTPLITHNASLPFSVQRLQLLKDNFIDCDGTWNIMGSTSIIEENTI